MSDVTNGEQGMLAELLTFLEVTDRDLLLSISDDVYKMLSDGQRRHLILYLIELDTATPLSRVALELTSRREGKPLTNVTPSEQERVRLRLEQEHLPRLADYGVLSWSYGDEMVEPLPSITSANEE